MSRLPTHLASRLRVPVVAAPMLRVSGVDLVVAACRSGVVGSFPTKNARSAEMLEDWLIAITAGLADMGGRAAPWCPNLIMRDARWEADLDLLIRYGVEMVLTSVGSPAPAMPKLRAAGCLVFSDVATLAHARKAVAAGVDGLVLLTAGAGGQTGWLNPFAFVRAVREFYDGPVVMSGGVSDGWAVYAAQVLGCDLSFMGTRFIAASESMATDRYRRLLVESDIDEVILTRNFNGLRANYLTRSIVEAGIDPDHLDEAIDEEKARRLYSGDNAEGPQRWVDILSGGHTVGAVKRIQPVREIVDEIALEYAAARRSAGQSQPQPEHVA